ncbi:hypothetical protein TNCV_1536041 [Trichonephila clavipes]|nr:hypothetical protein TNCV_1536041 [Trichonephila clavipes]
MPVLSATIDRGALRPSTALRITVLNPSIPYSANNQLDLGFEQQYDKPQSRYATIRPLSKSNILVSISTSYTRHRNNFSPGNNVQMHFVYEKPAEQFPHLNTL